MVRHVVTAMVCLGLVNCGLSGGPYLTSPTGNATAPSSMVTNSPTSTPTSSPTKPTSTPAPTTVTNPNNIIVRTPVTDLETLQLITTDLAAQPTADQNSFRYFSLEAWGNGAPLGSQVDLDVERTALIKMINMLSTGPAIVHPQPIDANSLIYRVDMRALKWTVAAWNNIKATDVYFVPANFPAANARAAAQTVRADWFVTNIPNSTINAYFTFLGINSFDPNIDALNNVNRFADMAVGAPDTYRAGLAVSGTETFNRILSWHQTTTLGSGALGSGYLFKSYNFDSDLDDQDIFSHPYEPTTNNPNAAGAYNFTYADSDAFFTLPNGLNAYYTVEGDANGQVMNVDNTGAGFPGPTFCLQCHDTQANVIHLQDVMNAAIAATPAGTFPAATKTLLLGMYDNAALNQKLTEAGQIYATAYASMNLPAKESAGLNSESTNIVNNKYTVVLGVAVAAAELGTTPSILVGALEKSSTLALPLASLLSTDSSGNDVGVIRRDAWEMYYAQVRALLFPQLPKP